MGTQCTFARSATTLVSRGYRRGSWAPSVPAFPVSAPCTVINGVGVAFMGTQCTFTGSASVLVPGGLGWELGSQHLVCLCKIRHCTGTKEVGVGFMGTQCTFPGSAPVQVSRGKGWGSWAIPSVRGLLTSLLHSFAEESDTNSAHYSRYQNYIVFIIPVFLHKNI